MKKITSPAWAAFCLLFIGISCKRIHPAAEFGKTAHGSKAMVVTAHPEATKVGLDIVARGGNAGDGMVAVHFALAAGYPCADNMGGGGFMVMRDNTGEACTYDCREKAPLSPYEAMSLAEEVEVVPGLSLNGQK